MIDNKKHSKKYTGRGLSLYTAVSLSLDTNEEIAVRAGYKPNTIYSHFLKADLDDNILVKYGKAIPFDFSLEYPELSHHFQTNVSKGDESIIALKIKHDEIQQKYTSLLEIHNELFKDYSKVKEEFGDALRKIDALKKEIEALRK